MLRRQQTAQENKHIKVVWKLQFPRHIPPKTVISLPSEREIARLGRL
jgi:hypothetical protein